MNNFDSHALIPLDHLIELESTAYDSAPRPSAGDRIGSTLQTTLVCAALSGGVVAATWGWAKAVDWLEERNFQRDARKREAAKNAR